MMILVEGCDKAGKTTLISDIKALFPLANVFKNQIKPDGKNEISIGRTGGIYLGAYQFADMLGRISIFDRSHITEVVYSPRRGYDSLKHFDWINYESLLLRQCCIIYMTAPEETIVKRFKTDNETYIDKGEVHEILERYDAYLNLTKLPVLTLSSLDARNDNTLKVLKFVNDHKNLWISETTKMKSSQIKTS